MKKTVIWILVFHLFLLARTGFAAIDSINSFRGINFSISITNSLVLPNVTNIFLCHISNSSSNLVYFWGGYPDRSTQFFLTDANGNQVRLTEKWENRPGGQMCMLGPNSVKDYIFLLPVAWAAKSEKCSMRAQINIYFDPTEADRGADGLIYQKMYHLWSNPLPVGASATH